MTGVDAPHTPFVIIAAAPEGARSKNSDEPLGSRGGLNYYFS